MSPDQKGRYTKARRERRGFRTQDTKTDKRQINQTEIDSTDSTVVTSNMAPPTMAPANPPGSALRQMLSNVASRNAPLDTPESPGDFLVVQNRLYRLANIAYRINSHDVSTSNLGSLIDGGANGGMAGQDMRIIEETGLTADVFGIAKNELKNLPISTGAAYIQSLSGPIIGLFHQYASY